MGALMWAVLSVGFHYGILNVIDGHDHIFSLAGNLDAAAIEANEEGFTNVLLHHVGKISKKFSIFDRRYDDRRIDRFYTWKLMQ